MVLVKHRRRFSSKCKPQLHKPVPREELHITAARAQLLVAVQYYCGVEPHIR